VRCACLKRWAELVLMGRYNSLEEQENLAGMKTEFMQVITVLEAEKNEQGKGGL
jgi:hypothetical protein